LPLRVGHFPLEIIEKFLRRHRARVWEEAQSAS
jgi:hypothetical protein